MSPWTRRSKGNSAESSSRFDRVGFDPGNDLYLETRILGSVQGKGKFLDSGVHAQQQWIDKNSRDPMSQGAATVREAWDD